MHRDEGLIRKIACRFCMLFSNGSFLNVSWIVIKSSDNTSWSRHNVPKRSDKVIHDRCCIDSIFETAGSFSRQHRLSSTVGIIRQPSHEPQSTFPKRPAAWFASSSVSSLLSASSVHLSASIRAISSSLYSGSNANPTTCTWCDSMFFLLLNVPYLYLTKSISHM